MQSVYSITAASPYRIAIVARPRGNDWLQDEVKQLRNQGLDTLVSLLTSDENAELGLTDEKRFCENSGIRFLSFPIEDRSIPNQEEVRSLVEVLAGEANSGRSIGFHCRAGIGRSSMLAALLLARLGWPIDAAFDVISEARGCPVPDTPQQRQWAQALARTLRPEKSKPP